MIHCTQYGGAARLGGLVCGLSSSFLCRLICVEQGLAGAPCALRDDVLQLLCEAQSNFRSVMPAGTQQSPSAHSASRQQHVCNAPGSCQASAAPLCTHLQAGLLRRIAAVQPPAGCGDLASAHRSVRFLLTPGNRHAPSCKIVRHSQSAATAQAWSVPTAAARCSGGHGAWWQTLCSSAGDPGAAELKRRSAEPQEWSATACRCHTLRSHAHD